MDDIYPNSSEFFLTKEQIEREEQEQEQLRKIASSASVLPEIIALFDESIKRLESVSYLPINETTPLEELKTIILSQQRAVEIINGVKSSVETMLMRHQIATEEESKN